MFHSNRALSSRSPVVCLTDATVLQEEEEEEEEEM